MSRPDSGRPEAQPAGVGEEPGWPTTPPPRSPLGAGDPAEAGPYRLEAVLGAGGMGRVYLGRTPAGSAVAVKLVHCEYAADRAFRKRFEQEVAAARRVQGLYTVPVVDADLQAGEPWLATAYVPGPSLQDAVDDNGPLAVDTAVALIARVAEALQSIHTAGVIHRDLKPSNIILTGDGPKVIDFGIARAADVTSVTGTGMRTGTPAYMAPEYIRGQDVTEACDVFALGVVAHFAATGRLAFGGGSHHGVTYRILEQDPDLDGCPEPARSIAAACLEKDPRRRPTPAEVIEQCRAAAAPGIAGPEAGTAVATATATVTAVSPPEAGPATPGTPAAADAPTAGRPSGHAPTMLDPGRGGSGGDHVTPAGPEDQPQLQGPDSPQPLGRPALLLGLGAGVVVLGIVLVAVFFLPSSPAGIGGTSSFKPTASLGTGRPVSNEDVAFSPDGKFIATGGNDGTVQLWDVAARKRSATFAQDQSPGADVAVVNSLAFSPDGKFIATGGDSQVGLWDVAERRQVHVFGESGSVSSVAFSPDGDTLASGNEYGEVKLWDVRSRKDDELAVLDKQTDVRAVAFSPDGRTLASAGGDPDTADGADSGKGTAVLWDVKSRKARVVLRPGEALTALAFSPDGKTLATSGIAEEVRLWKVASGRQSAAFDVSHGGASGEDIAFSPDGRTLATASYDGVWLWDVTDRKPRARLSSKADSKRTNGAQDVAFGPRGELIAGTGFKRPVQLWKNP